MWQKKRKKEKKRQETDTTRLPHALGVGVAALAPASDGTLGGGLPNINVVGKGPPSQQSNALQKGQPVPPSFAHKACLQESKVAVLHSCHSLSCPQGLGTRGSQ